MYFRNRTGDALLDFINMQLFPKLKGELPTQGAVGKRAQVLRSVFEDAINFMKSGTLMRQVINKINEIDFNNSEDRHTFGAIYEKILKDLQSAGNAGEFYTPRAVTRLIIDRLNPQLSEIVFDPACGTGGFLSCTIDHKQQFVRTTEDRETLARTIRGVEKKSLPFNLCITNMILHGIDTPIGVSHDNTLAKPFSSYTEKDRVHVIATNPPFGGIEEDGIEKNFPAQYRTRETADLFMALIIRLLRSNGRAGVVLPDGFLFGEGTKKNIKEELLKACNLHTIVRLPNGVFNPYTGIKTNILFFTKGQPTKDIWFYEQPYPEGVVNYNKGRPMQFEEFDTLRAWWGEEDIRKRRRFDGTIALQPRFVVDFRDPQSGKRRQHFLEKRKDAEAKRADLIADMATGRYASPTSATVATAMQNWLDDRRPKVKRVTFTTYERAARYVCEPVADEDGFIIHPGLAKIKLTDLQTAEIRRWHNALRDHAGHYSANRAMGFLKAALDLAAEDFGIRPPAMPKIDRVRGRAKKAILTPEQIAKLIAAAKADPDRGVYVATPFLTGMRIGEVLGLQWRDIDFDRNEIHVRRIQENDGKTFDAPKTAAGFRTIPMGATLRSLLLDWRERCPRLNGELVRVFPTRGKRQPWPKPRQGGGGPLLYSNYRTAIWNPFLEKLELPEVTPHSARHSYISNLQAAGIEVATVAKLAGHANPVTTLGIYSHAVRGGEIAAEALEIAYSMPDGSAGAVAI